MTLAALMAFMLLDIIGYIRARNDGMQASLKALLPYYWLYWGIFKRQTHDNDQTG